MMVKIPQIKKKIGSFLTKEDGKISKEALIKTGVLLGAVAFGSALAAKSSSAAYIHGNSLSSGYNPGGAGIATGTHSHHSQHSSY